MPVVLRVRGYKFWFYSADLDEPAHVHVGRDGKLAKFWLEPVQVARAGRFRPIELREVGQIISSQRDFLMDAWEREVQKRGNR